MWRQISKRLRDYPGRLKVAKTLVELGLSVREGSIYCGEVRNQDDESRRRRPGTVMETTEFIESDPMLQPVFKGLKPAGPFLPNVARFLGYCVIDVCANPHEVGIVTEASALISIRQAVADDPHLTPEPRLTLVVP